MRKHNAILNIYTYYIFLLIMLLTQACNTPETKKIKEEKAQKAFNAAAIKSKINDSNTQFVVDAANAGYARATQGKLAIEKGTTPAIKQFGETMMTENRAINKTLAHLADAKKIIMPRTLGSDEQNVLDSLSVKEGKAFDKAYITHMIEMHQDEIKRFENASQTLTDTDLRNFALQTLPVLKKHLAQCKALGY